MAVKKRDFQKISLLIQEFLGKLCGDESSAELRDTLNYALLHLQRYYKSLRNRTNSGVLGLNELVKSLSSTLNGGVSPVSPYCRGGDIFEWKWVNLDSPRLNACLGNEDLTALKPCLVAAKNADLPELKRLIENDSECVNCVDGLGRSALMYTVHGLSDEHFLCTELLIDCGSDVHHAATDGSTSLHVACHDNNSKALEALLKHKAKCNVQDSDGRTPLHWAAANSSEHNIKLLLENEAEIRACDVNGLTPVMWACHFDQDSNLALLQDEVERQGSDKEVLMDDLDNEGRTLIHWAVTKSGECNCLKKLLNKRTAQLTDKDGRNAFLTAAKEGSMSACEEILSALGEESLKDVNNKNQTALHIATICGHGSTVDLLLERGADPNAVDAHGMRAIEYAQSHQLHYCMLVFLSHQQLMQSSDNDYNQTNQEERTENRRNNVDEMAIPSAPPFEEIGGPPGEDERQSFDTQEAEQNGHAPKPTPRQRQYSAESDSINNNKPRRQLTLTRQSNISQKENDNDDNDDEEEEERDDEGKFDVHSFDYKMDGEVLVLVDEIEALHGAEDDVVIDCENRNTLSPGNEGDRGASISSVHSEQEDNAENNSVSMDMGVSSIGSDSEDNAEDNDAQEKENRRPFDDQEEEREKHDSKQEHVKKHSPPSQGPPDVPSAPPHLPSNQRLQPLPAVDAKTKKKKEKKKKKAKLNDIAPPNLHRGFAAPLQPPVRMDFPAGNYITPMRDSHAHEQDELEDRPANPIPPVHLVELPGGLRGNGEDSREKAYGHMAPPQGPLAYSQGQKLLRNTDFAPSNGNKMMGAKMLPKAAPRILPHGSMQSSMPPIPRPPPPR